MPDARGRLHYVIEKTEDAAQRTLTAVETMIPLSDQFVTGAAQLKIALTAEPPAMLLQQRTVALLDDVAQRTAATSGTRQRERLARAKHQLAGQRSRPTNRAR